MITNPNSMPNLRTVSESYDVIVAGGGVAGIAAAVAARRQGLRALLIEKTINFGGLATTGLINLFVPMCNGRGKQIIKGIADELFHLSYKYGYGEPPAPWRNGEPTEETHERMLTSFSPSIFAITLTEYLTDEGVEILLDSVVSEVVMDGGHCTGIIVENKSGHTLYTGKIIIDATGDCDVLYRAGVPTVQGQNYFTHFVHAINLDRCKTAAEHNNISTAIYSISGGGASLYGEHQPEDRRLYDGSTAEDITEYILENQKVLLDRIRDDDRNTRDIVTMPMMPQFRTIRHIDGDYTLTTDDVYKHFDTSVGAICDFDHRDFLYEVPYGCLVKTGYDNFMAPGRCASATGYAWDVLRVIPPAIQTGEACGVAAAIAIENGCSIVDVDIAELQARLEKNGIMIHFDDALVPENGGGEYADIGHQ